MSAFDSFLKDIKSDKNVVSKFKTEHSLITYASKLWKVLPDQYKDSYVSDAARLAKIKNPTPKKPFDLKSFSEKHTKKSEVKKPLPVKKTKPAPPKFDLNKFVEKHKKDEKSPDWVSVSNSLGILLG